MPKNKYINEIQRAVDFIEINLRNSITVHQICERSSFSQWEFQRIFRAYVGDSIGNYIRGRRLTNAAKTLQESKDVQILDVALEFQFNSQEAFSRAFKSYFNMTPGYLLKNNKLITIQAKPILNDRRLNHILFHINKSPQIVTLGPMNLIGLPKKFNSTLGKELETYEIILKHWNNFSSRRSEIIGNNPSKSYGVISSLNSKMNEEVLLYYASVEVDKTNVVPAGMNLIEIKQQSYAMFEVKGGQKSCQITADFIYGIWLPQSDFIRSDGFDLELFDHALYNSEDPNSLFYYCLPITTNI